MTSMTRVTAYLSMSMPPRTAVSASSEKGGVRSNTDWAKVGDASIETYVDGIRGAEGQES